MTTRAHCVDSPPSYLSRRASCPSGKSGGSLGEFAPGKMVPEFDSVVFDEKYEVNDVVGPIKTQFGYHLIKVTDRRLETVKTEGKGVF
jgi:parvulin-like peptidyl-prolyl isomerase